jgi:predicted RNase H-like nuclease (RuvC/YqgF family)
MALVVAVLSFGGFNLYNGQQMMTAENGEHLEARVKDMQKTLARYSPETDKDIQRLGLRLFNMFTEFDAKEQSVRRQHLRMSDQIDKMTKVLLEEGPSDERFHRSMDKLESMLRELLRLQRIHHPGNGKHVSCQLPYYPFKRVPLVHNAVAFTNWSPIE